MTELNELSGGRTHIGTIDTVMGHPMSGMWTLTFTDGPVVHVDSGYGVRQLAAAFGATEGAGDLIPKTKGQKIVYSADIFDVLACFTPISDWHGPTIPPEGIDNDELNELLEKRREEGGHI